MRTMVAKARSAGYPIAQLARDMEVAGVRHQPVAVRPPPRRAIAVRELIASEGAPEASARLAISARLPARRGPILLAARALGMALES